MAVMGARPARTFPLALPGGGAARPRRQDPAPPPPRSVRAAHAHRGAGRRAREARGISGSVLTILAAVSVALFYVSQSTHVAAMGYQVDDLEAALAELRAERQQLILQMSEARSPAQVERAAGRLGLTRIDPSRITFARPATPSAPATPIQEPAD